MSSLEICYKVERGSGIMQTYRRLPTGECRPGCFDTPEQAMEYHKNEREKAHQKFIHNKATAEKLLDIKEKQLREFISEFSKDGSHIYADAEASDDSGLCAFLEISVNVEGMEYSRRIYD